MIIRKYNSDDKDACLSIFDSNTPPYFHPSERQDLIEWLDKEDRLEYWVAEEDGTVLGCAGIYFDEKEQLAGFSWGMVANSHHGKGIGTLLNKHRLDVLARLYPGKAWKLETSQMSRDFYAKFGFVETSRIKDGFAKGIDKVVMLKNPN